MISAISWALQDLNTCDLFMKNIINDDAIDIADNLEDAQEQFRNIYETLGDEKKEGK